MRLSMNESENESSRDLDRCHLIDIDDTNSVKKNRKNRRKTRKKQSKRSRMSTKKKKKKKKKKKSALWWYTAIGFVIVGIIILGLSIFGGYESINQSSSKSITPQPSPSPTFIVTQPPTQNQKNLPKSVQTKKKKLDNINENDDSLTQPIKDLFVPKAVIDSAANYDEKANTVQYFAGFALCDHEKGHLDDVQKHNAVNELIPAFCKAIDDKDCKAAKFKQVLWSKEVTIKNQKCEQESISLALTESEFSFDVLHLSLSVDKGSESPTPSPTDSPTNLPSLSPTEYNECTFEHLGVKPDDEWIIIDNINSSYHSQDRVMLVPDNSEKTDTQNFKIMMVDSEVEKGHGSFQKSDSDSSICSAMLINYWYWPYGTDQEESIKVFRDSMVTDPPVPPLPPTPDHWYQQHCELLIGSDNLSDDHVLMSINMKHIDNNEKDNGPYFESKKYFQKVIPTLAPTPAPTTPISIRKKQAQLDEITKQMNQKGWNPLVESDAGVEYPYWTNDKVSYWKEWAFCNIVSDDADERLKAEMDFKKAFCDIIDDKNNICERDLSGLWFRRKEYDGKKCDGSVPFWVLQLSIVVAKGSEAPSPWPTLAPTLAPTINLCTLERLGIKRTDNWRFEDNAQTFHITPFSDKYVGTDTSKFRIMDIENVTIGRGTLFMDPDGKSCITQIDKHHPWTFYFMYPGKTEKDNTPIPVDSLPRTDWMQWVLMVNIQKADVERMNFQKWTDKKNIKHLMKVISKL